MSIKSLPKVALIGRTNVGKSTLFNKLAKRTESIVLDEEHVTRDYLHEAVSHKGKVFDLIDTGGFALQKQTDIFAEQLRQIGLSACEKADVIIFLCDVKNGLHDEDRAIARYLHKLNKPVICALNKADNKHAREAFEFEFMALGFQNYLCISAIHSTGINELLDTVISHLPAFTPSEPSAPSFKIALLGKPNVGKSSLMNLLVKEERSIVSDVAGTTREAVSERITFYGQDILFTDTAGIRRKRKVTEELESLMVKSSLQAVRSADLIILMVDGSEGRLSDQELKLLFYAFENQKGTLLVYNKRDLMTDEITNRLEYENKEYEFFLRKIPSISISCKDGKNVGAVMREISKLVDRLSQQFNMADLNEYVQHSLRNKRFFHKTIPLKLHRIIQVPGKRLTFSLKVNYPEFFRDSHIACIENILRKKYDLRGCPLRFSIASKKEIAG